MTHLTVRGWGRAPVGADGLNRAQADALLAAARAHPCGGDEGTGILADHHRHLTARQAVGVLASPGCSLEILPKLDPDAPDEGDATVRSRLVHMLDVALGLGISAGQSAAMATQNETLLDILIRLFADRLLAEVRRGLPRRYSSREEDLSALRGTLNVRRQFTIHAVRPDRLACRFDTLDADTPLMQVMKACVVRLTRHARLLESQRKLAELRHALKDVSDIPVRALPWKHIQIDRTNQRWRSLRDLARLFLRGEWQATHHDRDAEQGVTLLFPMNDLFEAYIAAQLRRALAGSDLTIVAQGGARRCLGEWRPDQDCVGHTFLTRPDILVMRNGHAVTLIDTKWKRLSPDPLDRKHGVNQADVYQMMAYSRLYQSDRLLLLYPSRLGELGGVRRLFGIHGGREQLRIATIDIAAESATILNELRALILLASA